MWIEFSFDTVMFVNMDCMKFCVSECNENAVSKAASAAKFYIRMEESPRAL